MAIFAAILLVIILSLALVNPDYEQLHEALQAASKANFAPVGILGGIQLLSNETLARN